MAEELDDGEFWLPSEFLADDFFTEEKLVKVGGGGADGGGGGVCFPNEFPYDYESSTSSPVESVTETEESDEEDYLAGLTRQMAHSFLHDDQKGSSPPPLAGNNHKMGMATSPQSTLCPAGSWSLLSREGSDGHSRASSPPSPLEPKRDDAWDLLYAARVRLNENGVEDKKLSAGRGLLGPPRNPSPPISAPLMDISTGYYANPSLNQHQLQVTRFQQLKQQQILKQQCAAAWGRQNRVRGVGVGAGVGVGVRVGRPLGLPSSAWPPLQQLQPQPAPPPQVGSGMRAVFLGGSGPRRESSGTGVFLPRRAGSTPEFRKKPACSTVLLPAKVVQALNLNLDEIGAQPRFPGAFVLDHDAIRARNNAMAYPKRNLRPQPTAAFSHEVRLPPEWTY